ncbi:MAG: hypothetical protein MZV70_63315 [Desulfobacterales bacterium]|nr:hypothetical protein [Desulfobacterales bacterium]
MTEGSAEAAEVAGLGAAKEAGEGDDRLVASQPARRQEHRPDRAALADATRPRRQGQSVIWPRWRNPAGGIDILMRRRQNNPILTGEAGVGKTAVVEGSGPRRIARTTCRPYEVCELHTLDLGLLAGRCQRQGRI